MLSFNNIVINININNKRCYKPPPPPPPPSPPPTRAICHPISLPMLCLSTDHDRPLHPISYLHLLPLTTYYLLLLHNNRQEDDGRHLPPPIILNLLHGEWEYPFTDTYVVIVSVVCHSRSLYESSWSAGPPSFLLPRKTWDVPTCIIIILFSSGEWHISRSCIPHLLQTLI
jgi:hypothetical protein